MYSVLLDYSNMIVTLRTKKAIKILDLILDLSQLKLSMKVM